MRRFDPDAVRERARNLGTLNGVRLAFVSLEPAAAPTHALLDVEFYNTNHLSPLPAAADFAVTGGTRIRGGNAPGQVRVTQVSAGSDAEVLRLRIEPIGDYSTYVLVAPATGIDPLLRELPFKFRPGCFNLNCAPEWEVGAPRSRAPVIDYLARDYDSFRHVLIAAMMERVPGWTPTSEADLDQVLIDLIAADADELADYQDRVATEAFFAQARKRLTLARHARLMDYHIHQGNQASTWLAVQVALDVTLTRYTAPPPVFAAWTDDAWNDPDAVIFAAPADATCFARLNELTLYDWSDTVMSLDVGSTEADLTLPATAMTHAQADALRDDLLRPEVAAILIQEELNPETGTVNGRDVGKRQVMQLVPPVHSPPRAESLEDPVTGAWFVRVRWIDHDALTRRYCFRTKCEGGDVEDVSKFYGNLVRVTHGRPWRTTFKPPDSPLGAIDRAELVGSDEAAYEPTATRPQQVAPSASAAVPFTIATESPRWGTLCALHEGPLGYLETPPGGDAPTRTSMHVAVSGAGDWDEATDFIESDSSAREYVVETDEYGRSSLRFGNGTNGAALPAGATVTCIYQVGQGTAGNVGADRISGWDAVQFPEVTRVWNPLDVVSGRDPEPVAEILRRVPEAYRRRQLRAVTLQDYAERAEELPGVSHARAQYAWTGSWRTVRVAIDPAGKTELDVDAAIAIRDHLDAVRLIGEDLEIRPAIYVPLDVVVRVCAHPAYWPEDIRFVLEAELSDQYTPDGRRGFFHPDEWTFGQPLYASQIIGRVLGVAGVERVLMVSMRRWNPGAGGGATVVVIDPGDLPEAIVEPLDVGPFEIIQVANDPDRLETGRLRVEVLGGRR